MRLVAGRREAGDTVARQREVVRGGEEHLTVLKVLVLPGQRLGVTVARHQFHRIGRDLPRHGAFAPRHVEAQRRLLEQLSCDGRVARLWQGEDAHEGPRGIVAPRGVAAGGVQVQEPDLNSVDRAGQGH